LGGKALTGPQGNEDAKKDRTKESIIETRKLESYAEHVTSEMHACSLCGAVRYKKVPVKRIGKLWVCMTCLKELKLALDDLERWENETKIKDKTEQQVDKGLGLDDA
jgi:ribosomal protein L37AE/L43A